MLHAAMQPPSHPRGEIAAPPGSPAFREQTAALRLVVRAVVACVLRERRDHPDVEDCTHEALRRAMEGGERVRDGEALRPWVLGIARHVALDLLRSRRRARLAEPLHRVDGDPQGPALSLVDRLVDPAPSPDERVLVKERAGRIRAAMERLSDGQRRALRMFHEEELGYQEIAARLGVPLGTVATWMSRGRRAMADALGEEGEKDA